MISTSRFYGFDVLCCVVVSLRESVHKFLSKGILWDRKPLSLEGETFNDTNFVIMRNMRFIYHSGDDSREDPPVPIPNTEVKLSYAESTWSNDPGG